MQKSKIEWTDYTINPVKGLCPMACPYCYARAMYKRFKWNPKIRYTGMLDSGPQTLPVDSRVFVGSTFELFGDWVKPEWMQEILDYCKMMNRVTWIFLTKQPQNLIKWSPFPENCWVGVSATDSVQYATAAYWLKEIEAKVKFVSFEPLLERIAPKAWPWQLFPEGKPQGICDWVIIGAQSPYSVKTFPKWEWVKEIIDACDKANIPVFLKDNLRLPRLSCEGGMPYYKKHPSGTLELRQEFPK